MKKLVTYFSASGVTKGLAEKIANELDGDLFEIEPVEKYTSEDLDWTNKESRTSIEMSDISFRPPIKNKINNINDYDTVILGFPVWWYTAPTIINTFIEENDLTDKSIFVFVTSGGSSYEKSFKDLKDKYQNLNFIKGTRLTETESDLVSWMK